MNLSKVLFRQLSRYNFCTINQSGVTPKKPFYQDINVSSSNSNIRLDKYLKEQYGIPWTSLQVCLRKKEIFVKDGLDMQKHKNPDYLIKEGDIIRLPYSFIEKKQEIDNLNSSQKEQQTQVKLDQSQIEKFKQMIMYEDRNIIILNKQNGVSCQGGQDVQMNLVTMGQQYLMDQTNQKYLVAHRLDKVTSGVLMVPKNQQVAKIYGNLFNDKSNISKYYIALVRNSPKHFKAVVNHPIEYSQSKQRAILSNIVDDNSKSAHTHYQVLAQFKLSENTLTPKIINTQHDFIQEWGDLSLLKIRIQEGRKHQIRVHLSEVVKTPILGDVRYFDKNHLERIFEYNKDQSIFLHCYQTFINNEDLCKRLSKGISSTVVASNQLGEISVEQGMLKIQANFPPHFTKLFQLAFNQKEDQLQILKQLINDVSL